MAAVTFAVLAVGLLTGSVLAREDSIAMSVASACPVSTTYDEARDTNCFYDVRGHLEGPRRTWSRRGGAQFEWRVVLNEPPYSTRWVPIHPFNARHLMSGEPATGWYWHGHLESFETDRGQAIGVDPVVGDGWWMLVVGGVLTAGCAVLFLALGLSQRRRDGGWWRTATSGAPLELPGRVMYVLGILLLAPSAAFLTFMIGLPTWTAGAAFVVVSGVVALRAWRSRGHSRA